MLSFNTRSDVFLFDVDGVITDEAAVVHETVLRRILMNAVNGSRVAFITGRSAEWLDKSVRPATREFACVTGSSWLSSIVWAGEMGSVRRRGFSQWDVDWRYAVPEALRAELQTLTHSPKYSPFLTWDASKRVTATAEARHSPGDTAHLSRTRASLAEWLSEATALAVPGGFRVQMSTYAADVLSSSLTKRVGADFALEGVSAEAKIRVFGDSPGDIVMAETARARGHEDVTFYWVGNGPPPEGDFRVVVPDARYAEGTNIILESLDLENGLEEKERR